MRLRVLEDAGRSAVPFTTGILIGIGETHGRAGRLAVRDPPGRAASTAGSRKSSCRTSGPSRTPRCAPCPTPSCDDLAATVAVARLVLGPAARIQAPPNLIGDEYGLILAAGIDDWGGVSPLTRTTSTRSGRGRRSTSWRRRTAAAGLTLAERLTIYPDYLARALAGPAARGARGGAGRPGRPGSPGTAVPAGLPWQEPDGGWGESAGRTDLHVTIDTTGRTEDRRDDFDEVYGDWGERGGADRPRGRSLTAASAGRRPERPLAGRDRSRRDCAAPRWRRRCGRPSATRPGSPTRRRSRCSTPTARSSTRSPRSPTTCAATRSATTSPTW